MSVIINEIKQWSTDNNSHDNISSDMLSVRRSQDFDGAGGRVMFQVTNVLFDW